jgi:hypothetical protein
MMQNWGVRRCGVDVPAIREAWVLLVQTVYSPSAAPYEHHMKVRHGASSIPPVLHCASVVALDGHLFTFTAHDSQYCGTTMPTAGSGWDTPMIRPAYAAAVLAQAWKALLEAAPACSAAGSTAHL